MTDQQCSKCGKGKGGGHVLCFDPNCELLRLMSEEMAQSDPDTSTRRSSQSSPKK